MSESIDDIMSKIHKGNSMDSIYGANPDECPHTPDYARLMFAEYIGAGVGIYLFVSECSCGKIALDYFKLNHRRITNKDTFKKEGVRLAKELEVGNGPW